MAHSSQLLAPTLSVSSVASQSLKVLSRVAPTDSGTLYSTQSVGVTTQPPLTSLQLVSPLDHPLPQYSQPVIARFNFSFMNLLTMEAPLSLSLNSTWTVALATV